MKDKPNQASQVSQEITTKSGSNFSLSFFFLPKEKREAITHFYALSRLIDDAVDDYVGQEAKDHLNFWKKEIELCYQGKPSHPVSLGMQKAAQDFKIPQNYLDLLIEGCEMDLSKKRYETYEDLQAYCYRVAGVVGLTCMKIFGLDSQEAQASARELGLALQLTNILRDVAEDAKIGRLYIPIQDIKRYGLKEEQVLKGPINPKLKILFKLMHDRAQTNFDRAFSKMQQLPKKPLLAAWIMGKVYQRILTKIKEKDFDIYQGKISLNKAEKAWIAMKEYLSQLTTS
ncbi:MAG: presqualene diphosphate synthase HpnD [Deltaproteobacteria bacterium]|nr:presqualene diphosphate synthase HpnD [Deltaproteobacteria bacterium]